MIIRCWGAKGVSKLGLFHYNQDRADDDIDGIVKDCRGITGV